MRLKEKRLRKSRLKSLKEKVMPKSMPKISRKRTCKKKKLTDSANSKRTSNAGDRLKTSKSQATITAPEDPEVVVVTDP